MTLCAVFANNKCLRSADILQNLRGPLPPVRPRADLAQPHRLLRHPAAQPRPAPPQTQVTHNTATQQIFSGRLNIFCRDIFAEEYEGKQQQAADTQSMASTQTEQTQLCPG